MIQQNENIVTINDKTYNRDELSEQTRRILEAMTQVQAQIDQLQIALSNARDQKNGLSLALGLLIETENETEVRQ